MMTSGTTSESFEDLVPAENLEVYKSIYTIENGLRELIILELGQLDGKRWYKGRLPPDVLEKYKDAAQAPSGVTLKPANGGQGKTGQRDGLGPSSFTLSGLV